MVASIVLSMPAIAADSSYELRAGGGWSDNIERAPSNGQSEGIAAVGAVLDLAHQSTRIEATLKGNLEYYDYLDNTYDSRVFGDADGRLAIGIVPKTFTWVFEDNFGQLQQDPFRAVTPANSENVNFFSTGPDLVLRPGGRTQVKLYARWGDTQYQSSDYDNTRILGGLTFGRQLSQDSMLSLSASAGKVDYKDDKVAEDYDSYEYYASYAVRGGRTELNADAGYRTISQYGNNSGGPLFRLNLQRELSGNSKLGLRAGSEYADSAGLLRSGQDGGLQPPGTDHGISASGDVAVHNYGEVNWHYGKSRTGLELGAGYHDYNYQVDNYLDRSYYELRGAVSRQFRRTLSGRLGLSWRDVSGSESQGNYNELASQVSLRWKPGRAFFADLQVRYFDRSADTPTYGYDETQFWLWLGYAPKP